MRRRRFLSTGTLVVTSGLAGCGDSEPGTDDDDDGRDEPPARVVESELVRTDVGTEDETVAVEGFVERTRDVEITYLEVRVEFYTADGEVLDSTVEHLSDVSEGDRWPFSVTYPGIGEAAARVVDYDVAVVANP